MPSYQSNAIACDIRVTRVRDAESGPNCKCIEYSLNIEPLPCGTGVLFVTTRRCNAQLTHYLGTSITER